MSDRTQLILPIPPPPADAMTPLVPARMVNEWVYCPRLAYLEWVEGEWAESADTAEGKRVHARVDKGGGRLPDPDELDEEMARVRSVTLSSERLDPRRNPRVARRGRDSTATAAAGKQPEVSTLFAGWHLPAGRDEPLQEGLSAAAAEPVG